ncbi:(2Fe-2S)-binding protein [Limibacillus sp. MBR-115]|uniref:(2Fe-2S)-binding protein n=1 Tax=Limibacillus sp. MBR-115 TaxID=3156465 RepID=UPI00339348CC
MYVCLCNGYRCHEIREVAREGASSAEDAYLMLGEAACCRRCLPTAQALIDEERSDAHREGVGKDVAEPLGLQFALGSAT